MQLNEIIEKLKLDPVTPVYNSDSVPTGGYCGDLLSDVIANAGKDYLWITIQTHINIVAVACLKELSAIIIASGKSVDEDAKQKAQHEKVVILKSDLNSFQIAGKLYELGIR